MGRRGRGAVAVAAAADATAGSIAISGGDDHCVRICLIGFVGWGWPPAEG